MRPNLFILAILAIALPGCQSKPAFDYSQKIVAIERSLTPDMTDTEDKVGRYFADGNFDSVVIVSERMEYKVDGKLAEVRMMKTPDVAEAENFKESYLKYLVFVKNVYATYRQFAIQTTVEGRENLRLQMVDMAGERQSIITEIQNSQRKYAKANGFRLNED